jgi:hypothetical protein
MRRISLILILILAMSGVAVAQQTGGQLCVRSFEDRNGSGKLDAGEPVLTRGISVNLLDAGGITIASALLDTSPTAAQGVVCFQFLAAGQYSVVITSADFTATTPATVTTTISEGGVPTVVEFGGQRAGVATVAPAGSSAAPLSQESELARVIISVLGALVVIAGMVVLGVLVYMVAFRARRAVTRINPTTGSTPKVNIQETSENRRV